MTGSWLPEGFEHPARLDLPTGRSGRRLPRGAGNRDDDAQPYNRFDWKLITLEGAIIDRTWAATSSAQVTSQARADRLPAG